MRNLLERLTRLRALYSQKDWLALGSSISLDEAMAGVHHEICHFKIMAMAHQDELRLSQDFIDLLDARKVHLEHRTTYLRLKTDTLMDMGRFQDAIVPLQQLIDLYPDNPHLYHRLCICAEKLGQTERLRHAEAQFNFCAGKDLHRHFRFPDATNYLRKAYDTAPSDNTAWLLAQSLMFINEIEESQSLTAQIDEHCPFYQDILELRLELAIKRRQPEVLDAIAIELLTIESEHCGALHALALSKEWQHDLLGAIELYHRVLQHYPYDIVATLKAIHIAHHLVDAEYNNLSPFSDHQRITIATVFFDAGYAQAGESLLSAVPRASTEFKRARLLQIDQHLQNERYEAALEILEYELKSHPDDDDYLTRAAECHCHFKHYSTALRLARKAEDLNWENWRNHFWIAESQFLDFFASNEMRTTDELLDIVNAYRAYTHGYPNDGFPYLRMAEIYFCMKQYDEIKDLITEAWDRGHTSPRAAYLMGWYFRDCEQFDSAIQQYTDAIQLHAPDIYYQAHLERATVALHCGQIELASEDVSILLNTWPDDEAALALAEELQVAETAAQL